MEGYVVQLPHLLGGAGGAAFDHRAELFANGYKLGLGGVMMTAMYSESWQVMGRIKCVYQNQQNPNAEGDGAVPRCESQWAGRIEGRYKHQLELQPGQHITAIKVDFGGQSRWHAGGTCLNALSLKVRSAGADDRIVEFCGDCTGGTKYSLYLPQGVCVVGLHGRAGDSLDALGVYVCPAVPPTWSPQTHPLCPHPFKAQVRAVLLSLYYQQVYDDTIPPAVALEVTKQLFHITFQAADAGGSPETDVVAAWMQQVCSSVHPSPYPLPVQHPLHPLAMQQVPPPVEPVSDDEEEASEEDEDEEGGDGDDEPHDTGLYAVLGEDGEYHWHDEYADPDDDPDDYLDFPG